MLQRRVFIATVLHYLGVGILVFMTDDWTGSETVPSMNPGSTVENGVYDKVAHTRKSSTTETPPVRLLGRELLTLQDRITSQAIRPTRNVSQSRALSYNDNTSTGQDKQSKLCHEPEKEPQVQAWILLASCLGSYLSIAYGPSRCHSTVTEF